MTKTASKTKPARAQRAVAPKTAKIPTTHAAPPERAEAASASPRPDTKLGKVVSLISAAKGASMTELTKATGWLPHTTRAALTGLRKRGFAIETERNSDRPTRYRLAGTGAGPRKRAANTQAAASA